MTVDAQELLVRKSVVIQAPAAHVFKVFTEHHNAWWPRRHHIGKTERFTVNRTRILIQLWPDSEIQI